MFDLRYHVASLTAVFVALVIGILVGIGLSGRGFVNDAERRNLMSQIASLKAERDAANGLLDAAERGRRALQDFATGTYPVLVAGRLQGKRVAVLFVGPVDPTVSFAVARAVRDAGGRIVRTRAIGVPLEEQRVQDALAAQPALDRYAGPDSIDEVARGLAREFAGGGKTPLWDALDGVIVEEQSGPSRTPADAVVVARPAAPQRGPTKQFLSSLYSGLARSGAPAVGVEESGVVPSAIPAFARGGLSTVDSVETAAGRLALVLVLDGAQPGSYGVEEDAGDGVLPPIETTPPRG